MKLADHLITIVHDFDALLLSIDDHQHDQTTEIDYSGTRVCHNLPHHRSSTSIPRWLVSTYFTTFQNKEQLLQLAAFDVTYHHWC